MKRTIIFFIAISTAFLFTEIVIRFILNFPTYGCDKTIIGIADYRKYQNEYKPYSKYFGIENGYKVFRRNNIGLVGNNVDLSGNKENIFLIGTSYIAAYETHPDKIASSIFNELLIKNGFPYQVINIGGRGHDPYDLYYRCTYYCNRYHQNAVILVLDNTYEEWFLRHDHPLNFKQDISFGQENKDIKIKLINTLRNNSAYINLCSQVAVAFIMKKKVNNVENKKTFNDSSNQTLNDDLKTCLLRFNHDFSNFILVSIINSTITNHELEEFCKSSSIHFSFIELNKSEYRLNQNGHLNKKGNELLGKHLYKVFKNDFIK